MTGAIVAHSGRLGPDELVFIAIPIAILVLLQIIGRRKSADADDDAASGERPLP